MQPPLTDLHDALGLDALDPADRIEIMNDLHELIYKGTLVRLIERMDEAQKDEFDALLARDASEDEVMAFFEANVPSAGEAVEDAVAELRNDILAVTA